MNTEQILREAAEQGIITCADCGNSIEPDCDKCYCGWINPLVSMGLI